MAGGGSDDIPKFTGFYKYFNSYTTQGRKNVVVVTLGTFTLYMLYLKIKPSKTPAKN